MILKQLSSIRRPVFSALLTVSVGLTLGLSACSSNSADKGMALPKEEPTATSETAISQGEAATKPKVYVAEGIAIGGADPVAYFTDESYVPGSAAHTYEWQGAAWQFANAENRDLFASNPEEFAPAYGGYCAWAVGQNALAAIDPNAWSIVDGKLYLNANQRIQERWSKDIPGNIALAEENWPALSQQ